MRLYATVSSERAVKGQGGNEYLEINIKGANREENEYRLTVRPHNGGIHLVLLDVRNWETVYEVIRGEKQKGECNCTRVNGIHHRMCSAAPVSVTN